MSTQEEQVNALRKVLQAIVDAVGEAGSSGLPSGHLYAVLNSKGISLSTYQEIIDALVNAGRIRRRGDVLLAV